MVSLFNGISTFVGYLKGAHTFPNGICPKVNVIDRLEFELAYGNVTVQHVNHYTKGDSLCMGKKDLIHVWRLTMAKECNRLDALAMVRTQSKRRKILNSNKEVLRLKIDLVSHLFRGKKKKQEEMHPYRR